MTLTVKLAQRLRLMECVMKRLAFVWGFLLTFLVFSFCLYYGSVDLSLNDVWHGLQAVWHQAPITSTPAQIIYHIRLPRVLAASQVGISLALAGATMQALLRNPLADGSTLGISSAASLGAVLTIIIGFQSKNLPWRGTVIGAILFALLGFILIFTLAYRRDRRINNLTVILLGLILSMLTSSIMSLLMAFSQEKLERIVFWTMGSLSGSSYHDVALLCLANLVFGGIAMSKRRELDAFALGEEQAYHLGIDTERTRWLLFLSASGLIGCAVAVSGNIAFVGLIVPHACRIIVGPRNQRLLPVVIFAGANFLMLVDLLARTLISPRELPIGVITSIIGALLLGYLFLQRGSSHAKS